MTTDDFRNKIEKKNSSVKIIGEYVNSNTPISCQCKRCNNIWLANVRSLLNGSGCPECKHILISMKKRKSHNDFVAEMKKANPNISILSLYKTGNEQVQCKCLIDNTIWFAQAERLLSRNTGCPTCRRRVHRERQALSQEEYTNRVYSVQPNTIVLGQYVNFDTPILLRCLLHNQEYYQRPHDTLSGKHGCTKCVCSSGEQEVAKCLDKINEKYIRQHTFEGCCYINPLKFDFYLPNRNICIEYQGEQHYKPVCFGGIPLSKAQNNFKDNVKRDNIKRDYCVRNNIKLIEISYKDKSKIKEIILKNLT